MPKIELKQKSPRELIRDAKEDWLETKAALYKLVGKEIKDCFIPGRGKCRESCALWMNGVCAVAVIAMCLLEKGT